MSDGSAPDTLRLTETLRFLQLLWALDHALESMSKRMRLTLRITGPQRFALRIIGRAPGTSAQDLAAALHVHPSTLSGILQRLEAQGLVRRGAAEDDARRAVLTLTPAGKTLDTQRRGTVEAAVRRALAQVSPDALATTRDVLTRIIAALESERDA